MLGSLPEWLHEMPEFLNFWNVLLLLSLTECLCDFHECLATASWAAQVGLRLLPVRR